jgi:alpha-L-fucosidase
MLPKTAWKSPLRIVLISTLFLITVPPRPASAQARKDLGFGMGPPSSPEIVAAAAAARMPIASGPFEPTWESIRSNYRVPRWFLDAKFGIFMHWGVYAVPAYHNEWYEKHMYAAYVDWHAEHFGPQAGFGYKDFIPLFTCERFDPDAWAALFKKSGARYIVPTAEHHDWFSLWDSDVSRWNAARMGPKRDLIGELGAAVRRQGLKFGVSNHSIEHYTFIQPRAGLKSDLDDPRYADFYWTDHGDEQLEKFLGLWVAKNIELIDKYKLDMLWFDNGVNHRVFDPLKLKVAAYYYNRAREWGKEVSISTKDSAYLAGSILDFEKVQRGPKDVLPGAWQVDDPIGTTWGYTRDMKVAGPGSIVGRLVDIVSKNGNLLLNLSPMADGTIPEAQQNTLLGVGEWLGVNGEAIYGTHGWVKSGEGSGRTGYRFTVKGETLYAIALAWPGERALISSLATGKAPEGKVESVSLLGNPGNLEFTQDAEGLKVRMPARQPCLHAFSLKIGGLKMNPPGPPVPANGEVSNRREPTPGQLTDR